MFGHATRCRAVRAYVATTAIVTLPLTVALPYSTDVLFFFFFNDTATTEIYTLSLHDALPIYLPVLERRGLRHGGRGGAAPHLELEPLARSEEHTSELQSLAYLVCRLLLEKKKQR